MYTSFPLADLKSDSYKIVVFGLSENGRLYADERLLASACTSFSLTNAHLIFTTNQHVIKFVHITPSIHGTSPLRHPRFPTDCH